LDIPLYTKDVTESGGAMDKRKYIFVGNRFLCLAEMLRLGLNVVRIFAVKDSFLSRELRKRGLAFIPIETKQQLVQDIRNSVFDILVSNGCPYILPISELETGENRFINIHPSLLPDLKGRHPINGAVLYQRRHGATCHIMDDGIDTGKVISQIEIPHIEELPLDLLYQLSFLAERDVFLDAYGRNFEPNSLSEEMSAIKPIYYSRNADDLFVHKDDCIDVILRKVRAFQIEGLYARFKREMHEYKIYDFLIIKNEFLEQHDWKNGDVFWIFGSNVLTKEDGCFCLWRLDTVHGLKVGDKLLL